MSQTTQPLTLVHTNLSPILNETKIKTHKLTLHIKKKNHLVIVNNTTYNKMTHSSHSISIQWQPSIHLKKGSHTLRFCFSIFMVLWTNVHTTYFEPTFMATTTIHCGINFFTPKIETTIFLVTSTKPNQPFENTYILDMAPPKILNYVVIFKKLKKDLINSILPLFNKKKKKTR